MFRPRSPKDISDLRTRVRDLEYALQQERETRQHLLYVARDYDEFRRLILDHFSLKVEKVPPHTKLVKQK